MPNNDRNGARRRWPSQFTVPQFAPLTDPSPGQHTDARLGRMPTLGISTLLRLVARLGARIRSRLWGARKRK